MQDLFTQSQGALLLLIYAGVMVGIALFSRQSSDRLTGFLVADRDISALPAGLSIAATWIWAPALFVAAQQAYVNGVAGLFWFTVPNVLTLVIFAFFADKVRGMFPQGFTFSSYMRMKYSDRVHNLYLLQFGALSTASFAVQLLAGGAVVSALTGIPFLTVTLALATTALIYSTWSGIRASVLTDWLQMLLILLVALTVIPWTISAYGGWETVRAGALGATEGKISGVFDANVFWTFGLAVTIGLLSGPFGDQSFWQRSFAIREGHVKRAFFIGAGVFALVPLTLSLPGFLAAGAGFEPISTQLVNVEAVLNVLPAWVAIPVIFMLLSGLVSTLDSCLCSVSGLVGHDAVQRWLPDVDPLKAARWAMLIMAILAVGIANIPGMQIVYLFLIYGTLRASTLLPTVMTILGVPLSERGVFLGISAALSIGVPLFTYSKFGGGTEWGVIASLFTVLGSGLISYGVSRFGSQRVPA
jgi:Na+/proline symporter